MISRPALSQPGGRRWSNVAPGDERLSEEETDTPLLADDRNYYKVEKWTKDGTKVDRSPRRKNCSLGQSSIGRGSD